MHTHTHTHTHIHTRARTRARTHARTHSHSSSCGRHFSTTPFTFTNSYEGLRAKDPPGSLSLPTPTADSHRRRLRPRHRRRRRRLRRLRRYRRRRRRRNSGRGQEARPGERAGGAAPAPAPAAGAGEAAGAGGVPPAPAADGRGRVRRRHAAAAAALAAARLPVVDRAQGAHGPPRHSPPDCRAGQSCCWPESATDLSASIWERDTVRARVHLYGPKSVAQPARARPESVAAPSLGRYYGDDAHTVVPAQISCYSESEIRAGMVCRIRMQMLLRLPQSRRRPRARASESRRGFDQVTPRSQTPWAPGSQGVEGAYGNPRTEKTARSRDEIRDSCR
jgi:hypothetical protein